MNDPFDPLTVLIVTFAALLLIHFFADGAERGWQVDIDVLINQLLKGLT